jgi:hypothetical protein
LVTAYLGDGKSYNKSIAILQTQIFMALVAGRYESLFTQRNITSEGKQSFISQQQNIY